MKKIKRILLLASVVSLIFAACKKSSDSVSIVGKWKTINVVKWLTYGTTTLKDTFTFVAHPDEYVDFRTDGKIYQRYWSVANTSGSYRYDTIPYVVKGAELYINYGVYGTDTLQIQTLTAHQLTIYSKYDIFGLGFETGTEESWRNFGR